MSVYLHISAKVELKAHATRVDSVALGKPINFTCTALSDAMDDEGKTTFALMFEVSVVYGDFIRIIV